jgi:16S rRNA (cytosine1402-N4)-methyltransferase
VSEVSHVPALLEETIAALNIREDKTYVDGTFGRGGHSQAILARLGVRGRLFALDQDPAALAPGALEDPRLELIHARFSTMKQVLAARGVRQVAGILLDHGGRSPQLDSGSRGFNFARGGPLDMRMDTTRGETAANAVALTKRNQEVDRHMGRTVLKRCSGDCCCKAASLSDPALAAIVGRAVRTREPGNTRRPDLSGSRFTSIRA